MVFAPTYFYIFITTTIDACQHKTQNPTILDLDGRAMYVIIAVSRELRLDWQAIYLQNKKNENRKHPTLIYDFFEANVTSKSYFF